MFINQHCKTILSITLSYLKASECLNQDDFIRLSRLFKANLTLSLFLISIIRDSFQWKCIHVDIKNKRGVLFKMWPSEIGCFHLRTLINITTNISKESLAQSTFLFIFHSSSSSNNVMIYTLKYPAVTSCSVWTIIINIFIINLKLKKSQFISLFASS